MGKRKVKGLFPIGVIGDTHLPFAHPRYLEFVYDTFKMAGANTVVHIGDFWDYHAMSFHETDPDGMSAGNEFELAQEQSKDWFEAFPQVVWISGNHDNLPQRRLRAAGLSKHLLRKNITGCPDSWAMHEAAVLGDVRFSHGIGSSGVMGHINLAKIKGMSCVMGHAHSYGGVGYLANDFQIIFGMNAGCGIDIDAYAMAYGKDFPHRPTLGCGLVMSPQMAVFVPMDMTIYSRGD